MTKFIRFICYTVVLLSLVWSIAAIGNGKVGTLFGADVYIASQTDMKIAFILNIAALVCLLVIGALSRVGRSHRKGAGA